MPIRNMEGGLNMKASDVIEMCLKRIPPTNTWSGTEGEPYGAFHVPPQLEIKRVLYCVTPTPKVVKYFKDQGYDLLISHHPYITGVPQLIFHTALDCVKGGLNDMWADHLGLVTNKRFNDNLGPYGEIEPISFEDLVYKIKDFAGGLKGHVYKSPSAPEVVSSIAICTGLGGMVTNLARSSKVDCYIIGENIASPEGSGFNFLIEIGHTLSERIGGKLFEEILNPHGIQVDIAPLDIDVFGTEIFKGRKKLNDFY
jgi:putative NIF3 family GTP cyclohydrolase 1 type 2